MSRLAPTPRRWTENSCPAARSVGVDPLKAIVAVADPDAVLVPAKTAQLFPLVPSVNTVPTWVQVQFPPDRPVAETVTELVMTSPRTGARRWRG